MHVPLLRGTTRGEEATATQHGTSYSLWTDYLSFTSHRVLWLCAATLSVITGPLKGLFLWLLACSHTDNDWTDRCWIMTITTAPDLWHVYVWRQPGMWQRVKTGDSAQAGQLWSYRGRQAAPSTTWWSDSIHTEHLHTVRRGDLHYTLDTRVVLTVDLSY